MKGQESYTLSINADKRYYIDEGTVRNGQSLAETVQIYNDIKMVLYNALYDKKYRGAGPLADGTTCAAYLKSAYHMNDYYCAAVYSEASAALSSQDALRRENKKTKEADIKACEGKLAETRESLANKKALKKSLIQYSRTGVWERPYPKNRMKVEDGVISGFGLEPTPLGEYEGRLDQDIRRLKHRSAMLEEGLRRARARREKMMGNVPPKIVFGGRKLYREKDNPGTDMDEWRRRFYDARHHSMALPGRHTSKYGNFLVKYDVMKRELSVSCLDGKTAVLKDFRLARYQEEYEALFAAKEREAICYRFQLNRDKDGRLYLVPSVILRPSNESQAFGFADGCVAMDVNLDHFALTDIGPDGERLESRVVRFDIAGKSSGQITDTIGRAMSIVGKYCADRHKCLVMENLDTTASKRGLHYENRAANRGKSMFAYAKMKASAMAQGYKRGFTVYTVDPAYTSVAGKILYMRKYGVSIHEAASYVIGLAAMGKDELTAPPEELAAMVIAKPHKEEKTGQDEAKKEPSINQAEKGAAEAEGPSSSNETAEPLTKKRKPRSEWRVVEKVPVLVALDGSVREAGGGKWKAIAAASKGVRAHAFYGTVTEADWPARKRKTLKNYFEVLKEKDRINAGRQKMNHTSNTTSGTTSRAPAAKATA